MTLAGCVLLDSEGRLLLMHRNTPKRTQWELPGGKVEEGETLEAAAIREVKEELGVDVALIEKLGEKNFKEDGYTLNYIWYLASIKSGIPTLQEEKFDDLRYFDWKDLRHHQDLSANTQNLIQTFPALSSPKTVSTETVKI